MPRERTIIIEVEGGVVIDVKNLPKNWNYKIEDHDTEEEEEERYCVKCGKTSDLIEEEDMCYTCAKERGRA